MNKHEKSLKLIAEMKIDVDNFYYVVNNKKSCDLQIHVSDAILRKLNKINSLWGFSLKTF